MTDVHLGGDLHDDLPQGGYHQGATNTLQEKLHFATFKMVDCDYSLIGADVGVATVFSDTS